MASVAHDTQLLQRIDHVLYYLAAEWSGIPHVAAEWDAWDEVERLDFVLEWPIQEEKLSSLQGWADQGLLNDEQRQRYDALLTLIALHRFTLEKLLED